MPLDDPTLIQHIAALSDQYEKALNDNDLTTLDALFYDSEETLRYGVGENLYGITAIRNFRSVRSGGSPPRHIVRRTITVLSPDAAIVNLEFQRTHETRIGRQSQTWINTPQGWKIIAAHVSLMLDKS
ncbi:oxalurate catabolism protein HpxZ [Neokomagataea anthophila]|uniref:Oxalurate catabolism protein HpxZ n=1 Tax=Neokomagataea anthophila TaxID=2826925 RepID=A0ABS5E943_9PROT|nr:oxalurate catabolism protein HpxZ [Neokomagataea anthophila]MBR0560428.1 oxalurate catabolism protein HpxZ [Neokomagataea anthophila]